MANSAVVGILRALLMADTAQFDTAMKRAGESAKGLAKDLKTFGQDAERLGMSMTKSITLPLVAIGAGAAKLAMDFESSFAGVRKTVEASEADFRVMEQQFRDLAKTIPVNVNELNRLGEAAGALGIPKEDIVDFSRVMAELGVTTNLTSDMAADAIARIQNIFGAAGKNTERLASTIVALGNAGASTEREIVEMAQRIAGAGHAIGLTQAQVVSFASALASVGINAEAGGTAISRLFLRMNDAVAKGGEKLEGFAKIAQMSVGSFRQLFAEDAAQAMVKFVDGIGALGPKANIAIENLIGKNIILKDTLLRLAGAGSLLADQLKVGNKAWQDNTALTTEANKRFATTASQLTLLWNKLKDVGITLGNALLPFIKNLSTMLGQVTPLLETFAKAFAALPGPMQVLIIGFGALAAAAGPALILLGQMSLGLHTLANSFAKGGIAAQAFTTILNFLRGHPVIMLISGLAALAGGIYALATAETALERDVRSNTKGFMDQTAQLEKNLGIYQSLITKTDLTAKETKELDTATRALAQASGMSVEGFKLEESRSDLLTASFHRQLAARKDLQHQAALNARSAMHDAQRALDDAKEAQANLMKGKFRVKDPSLTGRAAHEGRQATRDEELAEAMRLDTEIQTLTTNLNKATEAYAQFTGAMGTNLRLGKDTASWYGRFLNTLEDYKKWRAAKAEADNLSSGIEGTGKAAKKAKTDAEKYAEAIAKVGREMSMTGVLDRLAQMELEMRAAAAAGGLSAEGLERYTQELEKFVLAGYPVGPFLTNFYVQNMKLTESFVPMNRALKEAIESGEDITQKFFAGAESMKALGEASAGFMSKVQGWRTSDDFVTKLFKGMDQVKLPPPPATFGQSLKAAASKSLSDAMMEMPAAMLRAFQGGGDVAKTIGALVGGTIGEQIGKVLGEKLAGKFGEKAGEGVGDVVGKGLGKAIGGTLGGAVGMMMGPLGSMLGSWAGEKIGKLFGPSKTQTAGREADVQIDKLKAGLVGPGGLYSTFEELQGAALELGITFSDVWGRRGVDGLSMMQSRIDQFNAAQEKTKAHQEAIGAGIGKLGTALQTFGGTVPASLRPMVQELLGAKNLTAEMRTTLEGFAQAPSWQTMQGRAEALGIELGSLGSKFASARIGDIALGYVRDLKMFEEEGANMTGVVTGMQDELSKLYQEAKASGSALPESLKPYMQTLVDMGLLVDENGEKITNLNDVAFQEIEDKALTQVVDVLKEIRDLLAKDLPDAARRGAEQIQEDFDRNPLRMPVTFDPQNAPPQPPAYEAPELGLQGGTYGRFVDWGEGTNVTLHGKEAVVPEGDILGSRSPINITVISKLDGREVARNQVRYIPHELALQGL